MTTDDSFDDRWARAKRSCDLELQDMPPTELRAELDRIQQKHYLCSLGDRPSSPAAISMYRRNQIETLLAGK